MSIIMPATEKGTFGDPTLPPLPFDDELNTQLLKLIAITAAGEIGLYKLLSEGPRSLPAIAAATGSSELGTKLLVEALASIGYLERDGDCYANGPIPRAWLTPASPVDFSPALESAKMGLQMMATLSDVVRTGRPQFQFYEYIRDHPEVAISFARHMKAKAQLPSGVIAETVALPGAARRLLDLGGSHGLYSVAFCRRNPDLKAVVFDLPVSVAQTEPFVASVGLGDRISVQRGSFFTDDLGSGYDVVLCFYILHNNPEEANRQLIARAATALNRGGMIVIHDWLRDEPPSVPNAFYSLLMLITSGTRNYGEQEITGWLAEAGFGAFKRTDLAAVGMSSIITAVKAG